MKESSLKDESRELTRNLDERVEYLSRYDASTCTSTATFQVKSHNPKFKYFKVHVHGCSKLQEGSGVRTPFEEAGSLSARDSTEATTSARVRTGRCSAAATTGALAALPILYLEI